VRADDVAWVAGFLEGEGSFCTRMSARGKLRVYIGANSTDSDVLQHLTRLVPGSRVRGPYSPVKSLGVKPLWCWSLCARLLVVDLAEQLRPMMGVRRQAQIDALLTCHAAHAMERNRSPSPADHGTRTRFGRGCRCERCQAAANAYQRDRREIRKATRLAG
jgi:hypothetical protein